MAEAESTSRLDLKTYKEAADLQRLGRRGARRARAHSRRQGVPIPFERDGELYFELPNGTITQENPFADDEEASER